jgi:hypothetical protein
MTAGTLFDTRERTSAHTRTHAQLIRTHTHRDRAPQTHRSPELGSTISAHSGSGRPPCLPPFVVVVVVVVGVVVSGTIAFPFLPRPPLLLGLLLPSSPPSLWWSPSALSLSLSSPGFMQARKALGMVLQRHMHGQQSSHARAVQQPLFPFLPQQQPHRQKVTQKHSTSAAPSADARTKTVVEQSASVVV